MFSEQIISISKKAFIAHVNDARKPHVVDTEYRIIDGKDKLVLIFADGSNEIFKGLRAA